MAATGAGLPARTGRQLAGHPPAPRGPGAADLCGCAGPHAIDAEQAAIAKLQGAQQQRVITQLLAERGLLDAPQRQRLMDLLLSRYSQETTEEELLHRD
jgi:hypothetical protein